jgi:CHAT domain-containing protein/Tfp pilus assembly protein PilF
LKVKFNLLLGLSLLISCFACTNDNQPSVHTTTQPKASGDSLRLLISSHIEQADSYGKKGQLDTAILWYAKANEGWITLQEWDSLYNTTYNAFLLSYHPFYDFEALKPFLKEVTSSIPQDVDTIKAKLLDIQGYIAYEEGKPQEGIKFYEEGVSIWEKYQSYKRLAGSYNMLGIFYNTLEDYPLAEQIYREGIRVSRLSSDSLNERKNYNNLGRVLLEQGHYEEALMSFKKAQGLVPTTDGSFERNLAWIYIEKGQYKTALELADKALQKTKAFQGYNILGIPGAYRLLGDVYISMANYQEAEKYYQKCLEEYLELNGPTHREVAKSHINLGEAYQAQSQWNLAIREYHAAIQIFLPAFEPESFYDCPSSDSLLSREGYLMEALQYKGQCLQKKYEQNNKIEELKAASQHFQAAVHFINQIKLYHTETGAKAFYGDAYSIPYVEDALKAQLQLYQRTQDPQHQAVAFELAQQATAFLLRESINENRAMEAAQIPEDTIISLNVLNAAISEAQSAVTEVERAEEKDSLNQVLFSFKKDRLALLEAIENNYPKYYELKHALSPISIEDLQNTLDSHTLVVKYFLGQDQLYTFAFDQQKFSMLSHPIDSTFYKHIDNFRLTLTDLDYIRERPEEAEQLFLQSSRALYEQLFAPVASAFTADKLTQLTIIPDGLLNYLSFECLLSQPANNWLEKEAYLIHDYAIRYAYYAGLLLPQEQGAESDKSRFVGFGTEYNDKTLDRLNMIEQDTMANPQVKKVFRGKALSKLAFADDEVKEVTRLVDGKSFLNEQATKANFLLHTPDYEVVHVAAHSFIDTENDSTAYIVFNQSNEKDDFLLSLPEIYSLNLDAHLVTLSACQTGIGALQRSEGVMSLARAFQFAGSSSLIASQWSISDEASAIIMKEFYSRLNQGASKDDALREAKLTYLTDDKLSSPAYRIPAYWGAMILIGDEEGLVFEPVSFAWYYWLIGVVLLLALVVFLRKRSG